MVEAVELEDLKAEFWENLEHPVPWQQMLNFQGMAEMAGVGASVVGNSVDLPERDFLLNCCLYTRILLQNNNRDNYMINLDAIIIICN